MNKRNIFKFVMLSVLILGLMIALLDPEVRVIITRPQRLKRYIEGFKSFAPIIFIVLYTLRTLLVVFPVGVFAVASGVLFGRTFGLVFGILFAFSISMLGAFLAASLSFWLGRSLMSEFVQRHLSEKIKILKAGKVASFKLILYLRLIMIMPFDILGYASGAAKIGYKDFILGTMLGIIPEFLVYTSLGHTGARNDISLKDKLLISVGLLGLILVGHLVKKILERLKSIKSKKKK